MAKQDISTPKGTRDFSPVVMKKRDYIFDTIKDVYRLYGFEPIETPAMEKLSTLMGKYGEEGDKLLFKILNSGDYLSKISDNLLQEKNSTQLSSMICEKGLRYDLTVPFARYVVQHQNEIQFPFKRYQIQAVWRADRPQKGRFREFYQCDADVIGSNSLLNEFELIQMIKEVFQRLNLKVLIKLNNRKILAGIAEIIGKSELITDITIAIDKLEKIGFEKVVEELKEKGLNDKNISDLKPILFLEGQAGEKLDTLAKILTSSEIGLQGIEEMRCLTSYLKDFDLLNDVEIDLRLARGLNYYTGTIIEVVSTEKSIGSICGGGRYDDLTGIFGLADISGVGISFGADRIYEVMEDLDRFPSQNSNNTQVFFVNFGEKEAAYSLPILQELRKNAIAAELYPDTAKMKKQMQYANNKNIPWVVIVGEIEMQENMLSLKNMLTGEQIPIKKEELLSHLK
jgi:histidyl-tRNA synthetase